MKNSPDCQKAKVIMDEETEGLFKPYTLMAEVNGIKIKILRDPAVSYDMALIKGS